MNYTKHMKYFVSQSTILRIYLFLTACIVLIPVLLCSYVRSGLSTGICLKRLLVFWDKCHNSNQNVYKTKGVVSNYGWGRGDGLKYFEVVKFFKAPPPTPQTCGKCSWPTPIARSYHSIDTRI